jgi:sodium-dependent dicarboxylate transporter 2/3/5
MSKREKFVLGVFIATVVLWFSRSLWSSCILNMDDSTVALLSALVLFVVRINGRRLLTWDDVATIPWGVLILIGGSLAIASIFTVIGLNRSIASVISVDLGSDILMLVFIMTLTILMTELRVTLQ